MPQISSRLPSTVKIAASDRARMDTPAAPMSGHFATLLRGTAQMLLADHDVYTDRLRGVPELAMLA
jgi:poly-beta-hydroxyalkanoate depolymerase